MHIYTDSELALAKSLMQKMSSDFHLDEIGDRTYLHQITVAREILRCLRLVPIANEFGGQLYALSHVKTQMLNHLIYLSFEDSGCFVIRNFGDSEILNRASIWHPIAGWFMTEIHRNNPTLTAPDRSSFVEEEGEPDHEITLFIYVGRDIECFSADRNDRLVNTLKGNSIVDLMVEKDNILAIFEPRLRK